MKEIWKDVVGYKGVYMVSNLGRVKSLDRIVEKCSRGIMVKHRIKGKIIKNYISKRGYYVVGLHWYSKKLRTVHQLVAEAFLNHKACGFIKVVNHIDGNKLNNNIKNIELVSHRDNISNRYRRDRSTLSSNYPGVSFDKSRNKWRSSIDLDGVKKHIGRYSCELEAKEAYEKTLNEYLTIKINEL